MKQVPAKIIVGSMGETLANSAFQAIGWAPLTKIEQDIGDDRMTFARVRPDAAQPKDTWDLSAPVFIQVKASTTEYSKGPDKDDDGRSGWWFAESDTDHFDHWLRYGLPYLLVLQHADHKSPVTYWAEVKADAVVSTGKGRKIFVPVDQRVDDASLDALNAVAVADRADPLEGAVWKGGLTRLGPADRLRNALVVPRLVAPHPNRLPKKIDYEQAVALLMENRGRDLDVLSRREACPPRKEWATHRVWGWKFVAALSTFLDTGGTSEVEALLKSRSVFERDACRIVVACGAYVDQTPQDALDLLVPTRGSKPADRGWLLAQRAWMLLELERGTEAAKCAEEALFAMSALQGDRSLSAVRGGAAAALYSASGAATGQLEEAVAAQDNAGSWWRAQAVGFALGRDLAGRFQAWADNAPEPFDALGAVTELETLAWNAAFSASWGSWRHLTVQAAQIALTTSRDDSEVTAALMQLVRCGARKEVSSAGRRIWSDGRAAALGACVGKAVAMEWPRRSEGAVLALFERAGDLLSGDQADIAIGRVLDLLALGAVRVFSGGWTDRWSEMDDALARLLTAAGPNGQQACAQVVSTSLVAGDVREQALRTVAGKLNFDELRPAQLDDLYLGALQRTDEEKISFLEMLATRVPAAESDLRGMARSGSQAASRALLAAGLLSEEDWVVLGRSSSRRVAAMLAQARGGGGHSSYVHDPLRDLASSAFHTTNRRHWKLITDALAAGVLATGHLTSTLELLVANYDDVPSVVQKRLKKLAPTLAHGAKFLGHEDDFLAAKTGLCIVAGAYDAGQSQQAMLDLRRQAPSSFAKYARSWSSPNRPAFLFLMAFDAQADVRARSVYELLRRSASIALTPEELALLAQSVLFQNEGYLVPYAAAQALGEYSEDELVASGLAEAASELAAHPSALIRRAVRASST